MSTPGKIHVGGQDLELPVIEGTEGEKAVDISALRGTTKYITLDQGYGNTGSCTSKITFIDGEKGILHYRGYSIEELCEKATFVEVCYLLIHDKLPTQAELDEFNELLDKYSLVHEAMLHLINHFPYDAHPMNVMGCLVQALSSFYPGVDAKSKTEHINLTAARLIAKTRAFAALAYRKSKGFPLVYPNKGEDYGSNFLRMMFDTPVKHYEPDPDMVKAMNILLILHADHEQNCSTSTVRLVGSSHANLYASVASGIAALWGPLHGGANQSVMEMLQNIKDKGLGIEQVINKAKDKDDPFRLMGFGHRVYKNFDPRARIIKDLCRKILLKNANSDPLLDLAIELEDKVLADDYFIERKLYPNVDFYSGLLYRAMGFPVNMFTPIFTVGRMPGWIAHWKEMVSEPGGKIGRPRQIYTGYTNRSYPDISERK
ncbi:MAG: citrate synthase [Planctomycetes bacterium]|nr:citrate synthase [Planctomycetota bacterium]